MTYIDVHAHIYPDAIAQRAADSIGDFYGLSMHQDGTVDGLLKAGAKAGVSRHLVHSVAVTPSRVHSVNDFLIATAAAHPDRMIGFGTMHPDYADLRAELRRIKDAGLHGVKLHPDFQHFRLDDDSAVAMFREMAELGLPALVHTGDHRYPYSEPGRMARVLREVPSLKAICAHLGGWSVWEEAWKALADLPNAWVDTSSSLYALSPESAVAVIRRYGAERVMFGTDYPMWEPTEEIARLNALPLTDAELDQITHRTFEAFLENL